MLNITRFNPLEDAFDNLFRGLPVWLPNPERHAAAPTQFRMDVTESDKEYQVLADLPGVKKEDINITINGNEVAVSAEVKQEKDVKSDEMVLRAERYYGPIQRAFSLAQEVDEMARRRTRAQAQAHAGPHMIQRARCRGAFEGFAVHGG